MLLVSFEELFPCYAEPACRQTGVAKHLLRIIWALPPAALYAYTARALITWPVSTSIANAAMDPPQRHIISQCLCFEVR